MPETEPEPADETDPVSLADPRSLVGTWSFHRTIEDRRGTAHGGAGDDVAVAGLLALTLVAPDRVDWEERGTWHRATGPVDVRRGLRVARRGAGWWVLFEDGRDFHPWVPDEPVLHDCRPDTYCGLVTGTTRGWSVRWDVTGPEKDYVMRTRLRPASPGVGGHGP